MLHCFNINETSVKTECSRGTKWKRDAMNFSKSEDLNCADFIIASTILCMKCGAIFVNVKYSTDTR